MIAAFARSLSAERNETILREVRASRLEGGLRRAARRAPPRSAPPRQGAGPEGGTALGEGAA